MLPLKKLQKLKHVGVFQVVYKRLEMIKMTAPYVPGFLAFREVEPILHLYNTMLQNAAQYKPDVCYS